MREEIEAIERRLDIDLGYRSARESRQFEEAADAIVNGDAAILRGLLHSDPGLIRVRSVRDHRATLLCYVGANGVEDFRQKTPPNIVEIARILIDAGAEIDALADIYGKSTAFGLAATSVHPVHAGVQIPLLETLLEAGAAIDGPAGAPAIIACLHNGRGEAAEFLAARGAPLNLESAAGVGDLEAVASFFAPDGTLQPPATPSQLADGFTWACEYGRVEVVKFLLEHGVDLRAKSRPHGQTPLHWAAFGGHPDIVRLLLARHAPTDVKDDPHQQTPLGWALYARENLPADADHLPFDRVVELLQTPPF